MIGYSRLMGRSEEEIKRALTALSQMASKGQIMAEELKGQLAEAVLVWFRYSLKQPERLNRNYLMP